jgi:hypothetical protein
MKKYPVFAFLLFFSGMAAYPQSHEINSTQMAKNQIYLTAGWLVLYGNADISYERNIRYKEDGLLKFIHWNFTYGRFAYWESAGPLYKTGLTGLTGKTNNHLEFQVGAVALFDRVGYEIGVSNANFPKPGSYPEPSVLEYTKLYPTAVIGYRYQKPTGGLVFRTGFGFHEMIYLGLGYSF